MVHLSQVQQELSMLDVRSSSPSVTIITIITINIIIIILIIIFVILACPDAR
jgi:hypothetical protein